MFPPRNRWDQVRVFPGTPVVFHGTSRFAGVRLESFQEFQQSSSEPPDSAPESPEFRRLDQSFSRSPYNRYRSRWGQVRVFLEAPVVVHRASRITRVRLQSSTEPPLLFLQPPAFAPRVPGVAGVMSESSPEPQQSSTEPRESALDSSRSRGFGFHIDRNQHLQKKSRLGEGQYLKHVLFIRVYRIECSVHIDISKTPKNDTFYF